MAEDTGQERTEQATQRRREETRKRGQVARSAEINSAGMLITGFAVIMFFRQHIIDGLRDVITGIIALSATYPLTTGNVRSLIISMTWRYFVIMYPVFLFMTLAGILINIVQVGFLFTGEPITPKLEKINPLEGFKRIFSRRSIESFARDIVKIVVVGWIGYAAVKSQLPHILEMTDYSIGQIISFVGSLMFSVAMKILIGYIVIAILDYGFQRWDYERSMMMTRQEIRDEMRQMEGDPLLRARIRTVQREIARRRMMEEVPKATVVVTNPTEIAVALKYDAGMPAPVVVAKGRRIIAERIRNIAAEHHIPIVQNIALAQALFKAVDIGRPIPPDLYTAVAEVLAYVFRLRGKTPGQ